MILLAAALLLVAVGLLAGGIAQGSSALEWASFGASALAALVLAAGEVRRRARNRAAASAGTEEPRATRGRARAARRGSTSAAVTATSGSGQAGTPAVPVQPPQAPVRPPEVPGPQTGRHGAPDPDAEVTRLPAPPVPPPPSRPDLPVQQRSAQQPGTQSNGTRPPAAPVLGADGEPPAEEVEFSDLLMVMDLAEEVFVVDEHPRYHLAGCPYTAGEAVIPVPMDRARADGFTPCGTCAPDRTLAARERARRG